MTVQSVTPLDLATIFSQTENNSRILNTLQKYSPVFFNTEIATPSKIAGKQREFSSTPEANIGEDQILQYLFALVNGQALELNVTRSSYTNELRKTLINLFKTGIKALKDTTPELQADVRYITRNIGAVLKCSSVYTSVVNGSPFNQSIFISRSKALEGESTVATPFEALLANWHERLFSSSLKTRAALNELSGEQKVIDGKVSDFNQLVDATIYAMHQTTRRITEGKRKVTGEDNECVHILFSALKENAEKRNRILELERQLQAKQAAIVVIDQGITTETKRVDSEIQKLEYTRQSLSDESLKTGMYDAISSFNTKFEEFKSAKAVEKQKLIDECEDLTNSLTTLRDTVGNVTVAVPEETIDAINTLIANVPALVRASCGFQAYLNTYVAYRESLGIYAYLGW